ncbi:TetR/AcrR family transcriptional regulator [Robertkochia aurantiaca]|uniref:TetR/AcrR family transcriptional regulator n=1 Tax=Robertkochia aurantiaca TaxID=2873700 RepID=UPI001CCD28BD|nr:TetR/AcrR family transcriptional regulator [Robertkochia sp. 3YJGBD-33]
MERLLTNLKVNINSKIYLKDPQSSDLGKRIVENSILLIDKIGFEQFTFRKLSKEINSTESSIYRYFENKHKLLVYLSSWYWGWLEYRLVFATNSIENPEQKLRKALEIITQPVEQDMHFDHINEVILHKIVVSESSKSFLTKEVDQENKEGFFSIYKRLAYRLTEMIEEIDSSYSHPKSLVSIVLEGTLHQHFLREHFPTITNCNQRHSVTEFITNLVFNNLKEHHGSK